jgi:hypothetical protein
MLNNFSKTTNVMANSVVNDELAVTMRATVSNGKWSINKNISSSELYLSNQKECDADYAEFEAMVLELAQ